MDPRSFDVREFFHLVFLRHLGGRLSGRAYALKGGLCLRFFHRSARLSEDMDLDIVSQVRMKTLQNAVDAILESRSFGASLLPDGMVRLAVTRPKQTETTQRWKVTLFMGGDVSLTTKIEFSRRHKNIGWVAGVPDAEILACHRLPPFAVQYYSAHDAASQKVLALASESRFALRDLFDLHHLFTLVGVRPSEVATKVGTRHVEHALDKVDRFTRRDFREQVVPYLSGTLMDLYRDPAAFETLKADVERNLMEMLP